MFSLELYCVSFGIKYNGMTNLCTVFMRWKRMSTHDNLADRRIRG